MTPPAGRDRFLLDAFSARTGRRWLLALVAVVGETLGDVLEPWPITIIIDNILQGKHLPRLLDTAVLRVFGHNTSAMLEFALASVVLIAVIGAVGSYVEKYLTTSVSQWVAHDLRLLLYNRIQRLSLAEHGKSRAGDLITRVTKDIDAVQDFIDTALLGIVVNVLTIVGMVGIMLYVNWRFTLVGLSVAPVLFLFVYFYSRKIKAASRMVKRKESDLMSSVAEVFSSIHVVQAFAREDYEDRRFDSESRDNVHAGLQARSVKAKLSPTVDIIVALGTCLVLAYGVKLVTAGQLSIGVLMVFLINLKKSYKPIKDLSKMTNTLSKAAVSYERVQEVLGTESGIRDLPGARDASPFKGRIEFDHVTFGYDNGVQVLKDVSLRVEPGQVAAIVGPSGMGKSTIASLVPRFFDPISGAVKIDGHDIRQFTLKSLRDQISFVLQESLLFRGTIWENICYGRPNADAGGHHPSRGTGQRARLHHEPAARVWHDGRRARHGAVRWAAAADRGRPRNRSRYADPDSRRAHDRARRRVRTGRRRGTRLFDERTHVPGHRPPPRHDSARGCHLRGEGLGHCRAWHTRLSLAAGGVYRDLFELQTKSHGKSKVGTAGV